MQPRGYCQTCGHRIRALTPQDVIAIRGLAADGVKHEVIALEFNVSRATVGQIATGKRWRHVAGTRSGHAKPPSGVTPPQFVRQPRS